MNIDYQKFGLGNIAKYKQIEWCFENDYKVCDYGHGDIEFKRKWSNFIYNFEHHIVYNKKSIISVVFATIELLKNKS